MALYDWECAECQTVTEVVRNTKQYDVPPEDGCQKCQSKNLHKIIIRPEGVKGYLLLGDSGWHHTDYSRYRSVK